jgi:hypothetical protein
MMSEDATVTLPELEQIGGLNLQLLGFATLQAWLKDGPKGQWLRYAFADHIGYGLPRKQSRTLQLVRLYYDAGQIELATRRSPEQASRFDYLLQRRRFAVAARGHFSPLPPAHIMTSSARFDPDTVASKWFETRLAQLEAA